MKHKEAWVGGMALIGGAISGGVVYLTPYYDYAHKNLGKSVTTVNEAIQGWYNYGFSTPSILFLCLKPSNALEMNNIPIFQNRVNALAMGSNVVTTALLCGVIVGGITHLIVEGKSN